MDHGITKESQQKLVFTLQKYVHTQEQNLQGLKKNVDMIAYLMPNWDNYDSETLKSIQIILFEITMDIAIKHKVPQHLLDQMQKLTDSLK